jgi:hypothetical protein
VELGRSLDSIQRLAFDGERGDRAGAVDDGDFTPSRSANEGQNKERSDRHHVPNREPIKHGNSPLSPWKT